MAAVTVRNIPTEVHHALRIRAAHNGRSTEAEIRHILENAVRPPERIKLGTLLASIAKDAGEMTDKEVENFVQMREKTMAKPMRLQ